MKDEIEVTLGKIEELEREKMGYLEANDKRRSKKNWTKNLCSGGKVRRIKK